MLYFVLRYLTHTRLAFKNPGLVTGAFFIGYGIARISVEFFRSPEAVHIFNIGFITTGMVYSIPMIIAGGIFWLYGKRSSNKTA